MLHNFLDLFLKNDNSSVSVFSSNPFAYGSYLGCICNKPEATFVEFLV